MARMWIGGILKGGSRYAWWLLSHKQKQKLEQEREAGRFGGETAKAADKAPYYWAQEHGEPKAAIGAKGYVRDAFNRWRGKTPGIVRAHLRGP